MIIVYNFGPAFGLPDPALRAESRNAVENGQAPHRTDATAFAKAPKDKIASIDDDREDMPHSTFICLVYREKYNIGFDQNVRRYVGRMTARFCPNPEELAGCNAAA